MPKPDTRNNVPLLLVVDRPFLRIVPVLDWYVPPGTRFPNPFGWTRKRPSLSRSVGRSSNASRTNWIHKGTTYDNPTNNIAPTKAITNLDFVLLSRTHVLRPYNTRELLARRKGNTVDDGDGDDGLQRREADD